MTVFTWAKFIGKDFGPQPPPSPTVIALTDLSTDGVMEYTFCMLSSSLLSLVLDS